MLTVVVLNVVMLSVASFYCYTETRHAERRHAERRYAKCRCTLERLAKDKHSSLSGPFVSNEKKKFCECGPEEGKA